MPREGTLIADRYRLERKVGGGRVSAVWRVRDEISARPCAMKLLHRSMHKHPEALTRFSLEDRLARELAGPHFPERVGSGVWDGMRYIAWRWHEGESLRALFERNPKQDAPTVHSIVQETCQALTAVHAAGYAHGDLKPENILFTDKDGERSRQVKLLGFGVASRLARPSAAGFGVSRRRPGEIVGTPLYLSPDLILGRVPNGGQADLWALAVIVYEALTGRAPFLGYDIGAVLQAILEKRAPRPSSVADNLPGSFDAWWAQALAQEFDTPGEFASALARALAPALRTSHTQRSASLPDRLPPSLEAVTPMPAPPPARGASIASTAPGGHVASRQLSSAPAAPEQLASARVTSAPVTSGHGPSPHAPTNTSTTATGIGPADVALGRPAPSPAASGSPALTPAVSGRGATSAPAASARDVSGTASNEAFAPLPSPLRDLGAEGSRKTLVGITPPILLPPGAAAAPAPPIASAAPPGPSATGASSFSAPLNAARTLVGTSVETIEGAPCRPIDTSGNRSTFDPTLMDSALLDPRRPANPTVPFPRPRVAPRHSSLGGPDETPDIGRSSWHGTTTRTIRFVLTSPNHKPQRVAAALVCAAVALVIFAVGRSPVAGTAGIGQATGSLSAERGPRDTTPAPLPDPASAPRETPRAESAAESRLGAPAPSRESSPLEADELAPGLLVPRSETGGTTLPVSDSSVADAAAPGSSKTPRSAAPTPVGAGPGGSAPAGSGPRGASPTVKPPPRKAPAPAAPPEAPRKNPNELDFGI